MRADGDDEPGLATILGGPDGGPVAASYIAELLRELEGIAADARLTELALLLRNAREEAERGQRSVPEQRRS